MTHEDIPLLHRFSKHNRIWATYDAYKPEKIDHYIREIQNILPQAYVYAMDYYGRDRKDLLPENRIPFMTIAIRFDNDADEAEFIMRESI